MDGQFIKETETLVKKSLVIETKDGKQFSTENLHRIVDERSINTLKVKTLTGLVNYAQSDMDGDIFTDKASAIVIHDHKSVSIVLGAHGERVTRDVPAKAELMERSEFRFEQFMSNEEFIIRLKSMFIENADQKRLIEYVSKLTVENKLEVADDGVSQSATIRKGVSGALKIQEGAPAIVRLAPYRTFSEVPQPESEFLFRMRSNNEGVPTCALFEADGGAWKNKAIENILQYLRSASTGIETIIA